jgi:hypothetical protein
LYTYIPASPLPTAILALVSVQEFVLTNNSFAAEKRLYAAPYPVGTAASLEYTSVQVVAAWEVVGIRKKKGNIKRVSRERKDIMYILVSINNTVSITTLY